MTYPLPCPAKVRTPGDGLVECALEAGHDHPDYTGLHDDSYPEMQADGPCPHRAEPSAGGAEPVTWAQCCDCPASKEPTGLDGEGFRVRCQLGTHPPGTDHRSGPWAWRYSRSEDKHAGRMRHRPEWHEAACTEMLHHIDQGVGCLTGQDRTDAILVAQTHALLAQALRAGSQQAVRVDMLR